VTKRGHERETGGKKRRRTRKKRSNKGIRRGKGGMTLSTGETSGQTGLKASFKGEEGPSQRFGKKGERKLTLPKDGGDLQNIAALLTETWEENCLGETEKRDAAAKKGDNPPKPPRQDAPSPSGNGRFAYR